MIKSIRQDETQFVIVTRDFVARMGKIIGRHTLCFLVRQQERKRGDVPHYTTTGTMETCFAPTTSSKNSKSQMELTRPDKTIENEIDSSILSFSSIRRTFPPMGTNSIPEATIDWCEIKINRRTERNKLTKEECYPTMKTLTQKQSEYQKQLETKLTPIEVINQLRINELGTKIK